MKKVLKGLMVLAMVAAFAGNASANETQSAVVIKEGLCGLYDGNGGFAITNDVQTTATQSPNGNAMLRCIAQVEPPLDGKAVVYNGNKDGLGCVIGTPSGWFYTQQMHETVSASGQAVLTCHYNANQQ